MSKPRWGFKKKRAHRSKWSPSEKLNNLFVVATGLLVLHGAEEYLTGFFEVDPIFLFLFSPFEAMAVFQSTFLLFQICLLLAFIAFHMLLRGGKAMLTVFGVIGFFLFFEAHHIFEAVIVGSYYPGLITALLMPIAGFFFWKELIRSWKRQP